MTTPDSPKPVTLPKNAVRDFIISVPLLLALLAAYLFSPRLFDQAPQWWAIGIGALGWVVALQLRFPFMPLAKKLGQEKAGRMMAVLAGPCEELVRLAMILLFGRSFPVALSLGIGWGGIEILFTLLNGGMRLVLLSRDDEKARQAREILAAQGQLEVKGGWFLGVWERLFATAVHVGFTLLVAWQPLLVVLLLPVHSLLDLAIPTFIKRSIWIVEGLVTVVGGAAILLGLAAFGQL